VTGAASIARAFGAFLLGVAIVFCDAALPVHAASMADLRGQAKAVGLVPGSGGAGEQAALERLGRVALEFLDAADSGEAGGVATYEAIVEPLERSYHAHRDALDRASKGVIDADGDLDALYESASWKEHQQLAAQALYYLNWLHYRGALFYEGQKRKSLLDEAAAGFAEFATSGRDTPVVAESHLGRGLAYLELDKSEWAIADFQAAAESKTASPDRVRKARLALAEAYIKAGRSADALKTSKAALDGAGPADEGRARLTRARALLMAAASGSGDRTAYRTEASSLLAQLQATGGPWGSRATAIVKAGLDNPKIWAGPKAKAEPPPPSEWDVTKQLVASGKFKDAIPRLERLLASADEEDRKQQPEARYLLGIARFRSGDAAGANEAFAQVLAAKDRAGYRDDAAYLSFKVNESLYAANPTAERLPTYEQAITTFITDYPKHKAAPEARFRLGEIRQRQERYADAIAQYAHVSGDPAFELRAAFATAQSSIKLLERSPQGAVPDPALRRQADAALDRFWSLVESESFAAFGDAPVNDFMGQAALMRAYLAAVTEPPDYAQALAWLGGFEERYPKLADQEPQVVKLRLAALARLGRLPEIAQEAARPAVAALDPAFLDDLATRVLTTAARLAASGKREDAAAGKLAAQRLSEHALASKDLASLSPIVRRRLRSTLAALYEEGGQRDRALALYREVLATEPDVVSARAGAARILEAEGKASDARALWDEVLASPAGKPGWLEAHYQSARLSVASGDAQRACIVLKDVPQSMLVNANSETPKKIQEILRAHCQG
jgi:TolA-binding protein